MQMSHDEYIISTHTLTWSVTKQLKTFLRTAQNFNSHAHVERDSYDSDENTQNEYFNSHAHVERDELHHL